MRCAISMLVVTILFFPYTRTQADPGHPVAVRWWGQAMVSIETHWNLRVVIDPYGEKIGYENPRVTGDLVLVTHEHDDHNNVELIGGEPIVLRGLDESGNVRTIDYYLDQPPNVEKIQWVAANESSYVRKEAIRISSIPAWHDDTEGSQRGANTLFLIEVDGIRIVHCGDLGQPRLTAEQLATMGTVDVLLIPVGGVYTVDGKQAAEIVQQVNPRIVVPIHYKTPNLVYDLQGVQGFLAALSDDCQVERLSGNTLAISVADRGIARPKVVVLDFIPQALSKELEKLFAAKEKACQDSQQVFAKLNIEQMNFQPSNGTHTPRWNAEHMMGRELLFFSQIFSQVDSEIQPIDLNPKQMPGDYVAVHPDWTGAEEARQMQRVSAFARRFAYLLSDLDLDQQAPGSHWTPRKLLLQMQRHYNQHTANVTKKFELPDWPADNH